MRDFSLQSLIRNRMWNHSAPSSLLLPCGDDDYTKCEPSNPPSGASGFDRILPTDYDLQLSFSPSFQSLQPPPFFAAAGSETSSGDGSIFYNEPTAFTQFSYTLPTTSAANHLVRWTAAGETMGSDCSSFRGSKRRFMTTTTTTQDPMIRPQFGAKPRNQAVKAPRKRSQKLGDKITALQQLVSPYGKTDTASVLHEAAACIRSLHEQIQILAAPYLEISSPASSSQGYYTAGEELPAADLRRRGLCLAPQSPALLSLLSDAARGGRRTDMGEDRWFGAL